ncbi:hypothetical protein SAMN04490243_2519 [Robiginitalea myxolifaciens]|uniref:Uncharacterized protein n=1 Tax=Robiginitalea myxolifaciens TaxID=400055 RepID=A0A1I6HBG9_9FLAO|nr:hypothetical protein [Robiginitalea myxolifaciens]SFR51812.1 hypothetical protein SAMN04490243_2519 [Robiginitalea myxolifaciens]
MKKGILIILLSILVHGIASAQTEFDLDPSQSMIMTGKGPGQDATINPYFGQDCYAIVKNLGKRKFSFRIQQDGKIIQETTVLKGESKRVKLLKDHELYLDPNPEGKTRASVAYEPLEE